MKISYDDTLAVKVNAFKYDDMGRLVANERNGMESLRTTYGYDIRHHLTDISGENFSQKIHYMDAINGSIPCYNGNVKSLTRNGLLDDRGHGLVDNLTFEYHGNQVTRVTDAVSGPYYKNAMHFVDGADEKIEYEYNKNGAMTKDLNKGIELIEYNQLNLPTKVVFADGSIIRNIYDADGNKLRTCYHIKLQSAVSSSNNGSSNAKYIDYRRDYCGSVEYRDDELSCWRYDGGHLEFAENDSPVYLYELKDYQGNVRVSVTGDKDNVITDANHYYPFGGLMGCSQVGAYQYRYNDKELELTHGLNWYDYGARSYDGMRFVVPDVHAESYTPFSPYAYCLDNPTRLIDKDGNDPGDFFLTMDEAAIDFGLFYNALSIRENKEYGSSIYEVWDKEKGKGYTYSIANVGKGNSSVLPSKPSNFSLIVAAVHTHGAYDENYFNDDFSGCHDENNNILSAVNLKNVVNNYDIGLSNKSKKKWYVATPSGSLQKYEPTTGKITVISNEIPSDFKDPNRVNNKVVTYIKPIQNNFKIKPFLYK